MDSVLINWAVNLKYFCRNIIEHNPVRRGGGENRVKKRKRLAMRRYEIKKHKIPLTAISGMVKFQCLGQTHDPIMDSIYQSAT